MDAPGAASSKFHRRIAAVAHPARTETVRLVWLVALTVGAVIGTTFLNRAFERMQEATAHTWYVRGVAALAGGHADEAVSDLRTALTHDRDNQEYVLRLAQALAAAGKTAQAEAYFLNLWQAQPGSGELNLQLARIAVRQHSPTEAEQYYHAAIFGVWASDPMAHRRAARRELVGFLLAEKRSQDAQAELIALAAETPADAAQHEELGHLFLRAGNPQRALGQFQQALQLNPRGETAYAAAGKTAFGLAEYADARTYLGRAVRLAPGDEASRDLLENVITIEAVNPFAPHLRYAERQTRTIDAFLLAGRRLQSCAQAQDLNLIATSAGSAPVPAGSAPAPPAGTPAPDSLQADAAQWQKLKPDLSPRGLRRNPDALDAAAHLALAIEVHTADVCGTPTGKGLALLQIAQNGGGR